MSYYSRAVWGARRARARYPLNPDRVEGLAFHWPAMKSPLTTVAGVTAALQGWQTYHMDGRGWSDIAYQCAVDQAGNEYELRGLRNRSAANGDEDVNARFGAVLLLLAPGEDPSPAMVAQVRRVVSRHRSLFPNSRRLVGHADVRPEPTACPGPAALEAIRRGDFDPDRARTRGPLVDEALRLLSRRRRKAKDPVVRRLLRRAKLELKKLPSWPRKRP